VLKMVRGAENHTETRTWERDVRDRKQNTALYSHVVIAGSVYCFIIVTKFEKEKAFRGSVVIVGCVNNAGCFITV
jgi:hypothetical protein